MAEQTIEIRGLDSLSGVDATAWDACARAVDGRAPDPFTTHRFLLALEDSGSVGPGTGWQAQYLTAWRDDQMFACAPMYAKSHSQGEYVFDFSWADAYERAGGRYYPKLQIAVPFTPVSGPRFLTLPGDEITGQSALIQGAVQLASDHKVSSMHVTFCTEAEALAGQQMGLMHRTGQQFHWLNSDYADFDGFLGALSSRKRKAIRKERRTAQLELASRLREEFPEEAALLHAGAGQRNEADCNGRRRRRFSNVQVACRSVQEASIGQPNHTSAKYWQ